LIKSINVTTKVEKRDGVIVNQDDSGYKLEVSTTAQVDNN